MDWGAWLESGQPAGAEAAAAAFPVSPRPQSDPVIDVRDDPAAVDLTASVTIAPVLAGEATAAWPAAAEPGGEPPLTRRARRAREAAGQPEQAAPPGSADRADQADPADRAADQPRFAAGPRRGRWILPLLAGLLALGSANCLLDTRISALVALATFGPAVLIAAVPVIAFAVRGRRWVTVAVAALAALLPWALAVGYAVPGPSPAPTAADTLRVMTINAQFGQVDPAQIVNAVQRQGVDLLVVTELTQQLAHDLTPAGLPGLLKPLWINVDAPAAGGIGVWSRFEAASVTPLKGTRWPAVDLTLATPGGPVQVVAAHVSPPIPGTSAARWRRDLMALTNAAAAGDRPRLVIGDLNATPWHAPFRRLTAQGLHDAADVLGHGLRNTWPAWAPAPLTSLDHVLLGGPVDVSSVDTLTIDGTDHRALVVSLTVPGRNGD